MAVWTRGHTVDVFMDYRKVVDTWARGMGNLRYSVLGPNYPYGLEYKDGLTYELKSRDGHVD